MNPVAELLLGVYFEDIKDEKLLNLINFEYNSSKEYIDPVFEVLKSKQTVIFSDDLIIENIHGEQMNISSSASPIIDLDKKTDINLFDKGFVVMKQRGGMYVAETDQ